MINRHTHSAIFITFFLVTRNSIRSSSILVTMELASFSFSFKLILTGLITVSLIKFVALLHMQFSYWKKRHVPNIWAMPVLGTAWKLFTRRMSIPEYFMFVYNYYPNATYIGVMDFFTPAVAIRDPELIKEIAVKNFEHCTDHQTFLSEDIDPIFGKNVFSLRGERWKEMRNTLSPSFTASKMKFMYDLVSKCSREFVDYLYNNPEYSSMIETKDSFTRYTNDVIATVAFGINVNSSRDRDNEFYKKGGEVTKFGGFFRLLKLLIFRMNPRLARMAGLSFFSRDVGNFFKRVVSETVKVRDEQNIVRPDMIHLLMQARNKEKLASHQMTIDDITAQAFIFFFAGFDTSSTLMCFIVYELALNPEVQEKLREEVERYMAEGDGEISYEALSKMDYMEMVTSETLRKYPPVVFIDRLCTQKFELPPAEAGYNSVTVHPDNIVWFPVYALHHDPKYFPDPEKFDPERFSEENKDNIVPYSYMPFGVGPRKCIGNRFALMETKILIANLLHKFYLKPSEKTTIPIQFSKINFSLTPDNGLWVAMERRNI